MTKTISLAYRDGGSDKVYNASLAEQAGGYVVNFAYGRRGNALTVGSKTTAPVAIEAANKIFDKLIKEKMAKGYSIESGTIPAIANTVDNEKVDTGMHAQLLNAIEEDYAMKLIKDDNYMAQEKYDGRRMRLKKTGFELIAANRKGQQIPVPAEFASLVDFPVDFEIDGENMGEYFALFDILSLGGQSVAKQPAIERARLLIDAFSIANFVPIVRIFTASTTHQKINLYERLVTEKAEGIVFKLKSAPYVPGRPASKGPQLKFKFYATASFIVRNVNTQRSVLLGLYNNVTIPSLPVLMDAGNCTIPINHNVPQVGDIVEVKYLYAFKESGSVYQPSYLGKRDDVADAECTVAQLKFKPEEKE